MSNSTGQTGEKLSLREMCEALGVSRRAVQGYELYGLVKPGGKTAMGHLYYDRAAQQRVRRIHQYQKYGFQVKEIADLLAMPEAALRQALEQRLAALCRKSGELEEIITELRGDIARLEADE